MRSALTRRSIVSAAPAAFAAAAVPATPAFAAPADPIFLRIEQHKALRIRVNTMPEADDNPAFQAACDEEEAALQALGDLVPTSTAGAAALLAYMAEVEGVFARNGSPLLQTVLSVAKGLASLHGTIGA